MKSRSDVGKLKILKKEEIGSNTKEYNEKGRDWIIE